MTDQIKLIIEQITSQWASKPKVIASQISNKIAEKVSQETGHSILSDRKDEVSKENANTIIDFFSSSTCLQSNPFIKQVANNDIIIYL